MRHVDRTTNGHRLGEGCPSLRSRCGFSLVELLMVIGIIALLVSIIVPTIAKARESAIRVQCASNLRQCGMAERMYANENDGWLILRKYAWAADAEMFTDVGDGYLNVNITRYAPPSIWFCPNYQSMYFSQTLWGEKERVAFVAKNRIGYAIFGGFWNAGTGKSELSNPWFSLHPYLDARAYKIHQLKADQMRMTEWFVFNSSPWKDKPIAFHLRKRISLSSKIPRPEGGNMLMGDGSVQWSRVLWKEWSSSDTPVYTVPEHFQYPWR